VTRAVNSAAPSKRHDTVSAVGDLTIHVEGGTTTGSLAFNDSGKSTTLRGLCSLAKPTTSYATSLDILFDQCQLGHATKVKHE
jgi:ABC-2 type transport system ATP-binding protein